MGREENNRKPFNDKEMKVIELMLTRWVSSEEFSRILGGEGKRQMSLVKMDRLQLMEEKRGGRVFYKILTDEDIERWQNENKKGV